MTYAWLLPLIPAVGVALILFGLRFFPVPRPNHLQLEFDYGPSSIAANVDKPKKKQRTARTSENVIHEDLPDIEPFDDDR